jgi:hypothetical protein
VRLHLVSLDAATGAPRSSAELANLGGADPRLGPLLIHNNDIWTFWRADPSSANCDIIRLRPDKSE